MRCSKERSSSSRLTPTTTSPTSSPRLSTRPNSSSVVTIFSLQCSDEEGRGKCCAKRTRHACICRSIMRPSLHAWALADRRLAADSTGRLSDGAIANPCRWTLLLASGYGGEMSAAAAVARPAAQPAQPAHPHTPLSPSSVYYCSGVVVDFTT